MQIGRSHVRVRTRHTAIGGLAAILLLSGCAALGRYNFFDRLDLAPAEVVYLDQGWSAEERDFFYHAPEGIGFVPYDWFLALEKPKLNFWSTSRLSDDDYLSGLGFIPSPVSERNPDGLPIGLVKNTVRDPVTGETTEQLGFNCATCHTAEIRYAGKAIRVDGAPAMISLEKLQAALGAAMLLTRKQPSRFHRFAARVLADDNDGARRDELRAAIDRWMAESKTRNPGKAPDGRKLTPTAEGFGRLDALGRGGNFVFGAGISTANLAVANAPVSYPRIWDVSWFDWVQYNGSIRQPMARNVAQALGVFAKTNLTGPEDTRFESSVQIASLRKIENVLAGSAPGKGLRPPPWPAEILGPIDRARATRGEALFRDNCAKCHAPGKWTKPDRAGRRYRVVSLLPLDVIGTDPLAAENFVERKVDTGKLGLGTISAVKALRIVTGKVMEKQFDKLGLSAEERAAWSGHRKNEWVARRAYRSPPLEGVWSTAPYLHNGAVPSLYQMLVPAAERDKVFHVGSRDFDPFNVGFSTESTDGTFEFRTDIPGNWNQGHEFRDGPKAKGKIGRLLSHDERLSLIEFLKTL